MSNTTTKVTSIDDYKASKNVTSLKGFTSKAGKRYLTLPDGTFVGMIADDFDATKPAVVMSMLGETGDTWDFVCNGTPREAEFVL